MCKIYWNRIRIKKYFFLSNYVIVFIILFFLIRPLGDVSLTKWVTEECSAKLSGICGSDKAAKDLLKCTNCENTDYQRSRILKSLGINIKVRGCPTINLTKNIKNRLLLSTKNLKLASDMFRIHLFAFS